MMGLFFFFFCRGKSFFFQLVFGWEVVNLCFFYQINSEQLFSFNQGVRFSLVFIFNSLMRGGEELRGGEGLELESSITQVWESQVVYLVERGMESVQVYIGKGYSILFYLLLLGQDRRRIEVLVVGEDDVDEVSQGYVG